MPRVSPVNFARALAPALRQASSIASTLEGRVANRPKAGEATPVKAALTSADTACQEALLVPLFEHFPKVRLEAEEDTPTARRFPAHGDALVVVDPIDGTLRFYLEGQGPYAVMIGLAYGGEYEAALVALPGERLFFSATRGGGARFALEEAPLRPVRVEVSGQRIFVSHDLPEAARASLRARGFEPVSASGGAIAVAPLVPGVRAGLRWVRGKGVGVSIRGRIGALIAEEAGALVRCETGEPFPRRLDEPAAALLVAAGDEDLRVLQDALAAAAP
jgi:fructose-1,6-bisphosphatase/inositol monophosphatase family enzyme